MSVTVNPYTNCGTCAACRNGRVNACKHNETFGVQRNGAMGEYLSLPWQKVIPAAGISPRDCALIEPMSVGSMPSPGTGDRYRHSPGNRLRNDWLRSIVRAALRGATVIAMDLDDDKLELGKRIGARYTINSRTENVHERVQEYSGGMGADVVIEAVAVRPLT